MVLSATLEMHLRFIERTDALRDWRFALLLAIPLAACNSTTYYHNPDKSVAEYEADYEECRRIAYVDNHDVRLGGFNGLNDNIGGVATGLFDSNTVDNDSLDRQNLNFRKCMFVNGYAQYWVDGDMNDELRAMSPEESLEARARLGTAKEPIGELEPYPPYWRLPNKS